jgi:hypothetical protein
LRIGARAPRRDPQPFTSPIAVTNPGAASPVDAVVLPVEIRAKRDKTTILFFHRMWITFRADVPYSITLPGFTDT